MKYRGDEFLFFLIVADVATLNVVKSTEADVIFRVRTRKVAKQKQSIVWLTDGMLQEELLSNNKAYSYRQTDRKIDTEAENLYPTKARAKFHKAFPVSG